jgi:Tol biopolymer transport system component
LLDADKASYSGLKWTPDGKYLIYARYSHPDSNPNIGRFDIYMADVQTSVETHLVIGGDLPELLL